MTDWADSIEIRNNGIKCVIDSRVLSELMRTLVSLGLIAGAFFFYSWTRSQIVNTGYDTQTYFIEEQKLLDIQLNLIAEEETLTNPMRIDKIATRELGMTKLHPSQLILPPVRTRDAGIADSLAMAESASQNLKNSKKRESFGTLFN
jgi:cell division protein FtsL